MKQATTSLVKRLALSVLVLVAGACAERRLLQREEEIRTLPEDFEFPEFSCDFQGQFPYVVSVRDKTAQKEHLCGGVVIAKNAVLTAAHCVDPRTSNKATTTPTVHIGGVDSDSPVQKRKTLRAFPHPKWSGSIEDGNDIIILKLDKKTCAQSVPTLGANGATNREALRFLGFGRTAVGGSFSFVLQAADFTSFNNTHCNERYDIDPPLMNRQLCVRGQAAVGVCSGDEGGPLIYQPTLLDFKDVLIGIASYTTAECTETEGAAVFMDVRKYRRWIKRTLNSEEFKAT